MRYSSMRSVAKNGLQLWKKPCPKLTEATEAYQTAKEREAHAVEQQRLAEAVMSDAVKAHEAASSSCRGNLRHVAAGDAGSSRRYGN